MTKPKLPDWITLTKDTQLLYDSLVSSSERDCAIIGAAFLDAQLGNLLKAHLRKGKTAEKLLERPGGILTEYFNRASLLYCLGLISPSTYDNLLKIGEIRNKIAHDYLIVNFETTEISNLIHEISLPSTADGKDPWGEVKKNTRNRFMFGVLIATGELYVNISSQLAMNPKSE